ncbi:MAG: CHAT domain-containing tetratricopeptide repeat protein [Bacteroidota bacterium]
MKRLELNILPFLLCNFLLLLSFFSGFSQEDKERKLEQQMARAEEMIEDGDYNLSQEFLRGILYTLKENQDNPSYLKALNLFAQNCGTLSQFKQQSIYLDSAIAIAEKYELKETMLFTQTQNLQGSYYENIGLYSKAREAYKKARDLSLKASPPDTLQISQQLIALGRTNRLLGDLPQAQKFYEEALALDQQAFGEMSERVAVDYNELGVHYEKSGDFGKSKELQEASIRVYRKLGMENSLGIAASYNNLGNALFYLGDFERALKNYQSSLGIYQKKLGERSLKAAYLTMNVGIIYAVQGDFQTALTYFDKEREIKQEIYEGAHPDLIFSYNNLAAAYQRMGEDEKSLEMYLKSLEVAKEVHGERNPMLSQTYENISYAYQLKGEYDKSLEFMQMGLIAGSKEFDSMDPTTNPVVDDFLDPANRMRALREKANIYEKKGRANGNESRYLEQALNQNFKAIELLDHLRSSYKAENSKLYWQQGSSDYFERSMNLAYELYKKENDPSYIDRAFELMGKNKSLLLLANVLQNKGQQYAGISDELLDLEDSLSQEMNFYETLMANSSDSLISQEFEGIFFRRKQSYDSLMVIFEENYPLYHKLKYNTQVSDITSLQNGLLAANTNWCEYFVGDSSLFAVYVGPGKKSFHKLSSPQGLDSMIADFRSNLYTYFIGQEQDEEGFLLSSQTYRQQAHQLYQKLLAPILGKDFPERLVIVPHKSIGYLPFDVLLTKETSDDTGFKALPYLIRESSISYSYSATLLKEMKELKRQNFAGNEVLAIAPEFEDKQMAYADVESARREGLGPLFYNKKEVDQIRQIMGGRSLLGKEATTENFKSFVSQYNIIHFATHGKLNTSNSDFSYLAMSPGASEQEDFLFVNDLYTMNIPAEMVVLSACETGLGELKAGEGIASLSRAFSYAGAQSIITTLWSVNDQKTAELMQRFYQNIAEGEVKDVALQKAKLSFLEAQDNYHAHPFFWAAPIPVGNMEAIENPFPTYVYGIVLLLILLLFFAIYRRKRRAKI